MALVGAFEAELTHDSVTRERRQLVEAGGDRLQDWSCASPSHLAQGVHGLRRAESLAVKAFNKSRELTDSRHDIHRSSNVFPPILYVRRLKPVAAETTTYTYRIVVAVPTKYKLALLLLEPLVGWTLISFAAGRALGICAAFGKSLVGILALLGSISRCCMVK